MYNPTSTMPDFPDQDSRDAYHAGYSDGYYLYEKEPGDWPFQPYSRGYWDGFAEYFDEQEEQET